MVTYFEYRVSFEESGSFFVQIEYSSQDSATGNQVAYSKPSYLNVEPILSFKRDDVHLDSQQIHCKELSIMSVLSRCLGSVDRWVDVLKPVSEQGYNAIHYTPIQQYGQSLSHYSLADQTKIDEHFF